MTDQVISDHAARSRTATAFDLPQVIVGTGACTSVAFFMLALLEHAGVLHSLIGHHISYLMFDIEKVWKPTDGHHDEWGDWLFASLSLPTFAGIFLAGIAQWWRDR